MVQGKGRGDEIESLGARTAVPHAGAGGKDRRNVAAEHMAKRRGVRLVPGGDRIGGRDDQVNVGRDEAGLRNRFFEGDGGGFAGGVGPPPEAATAIAVAAAATRMTAPTTSNSRNVESVRRRRLMRLLLSETLSPCTTGA